nr:unnamed protein product [Digitaria exilis]
MATMAVQLAAACFVVVVVLLLPAAPATARTVVTPLPGYDGPLPFHLETGYVDVEEMTGTELFYYFVEYSSQSGARPRIPSSCGCRVSNMVFLDSPVGSGFSYARDPKGYDIGDISSSRQVVTFLRKEYRYYLSYFWVNDNATRAALGIRELRFY